MTLDYDKWLEDLNLNMEYQFREYHVGLRYYIAGIDVFRDDLIPEKVEL